MGNYLGFFSSCTFCVHVVEKPLRIYRILRIFSKSVSVGSCTFCVYCTNLLTAYLPHYPDFYRCRAYWLMYLLCTPRQPAYCVFTAFSGFLASRCLLARVLFVYTSPEEQKQHLEVVFLPPALRNDESDSVPK